MTRAAAVILGVGLASVLAGCGGAADGTPTQPGPPPPDTDTTVSDTVGTVLTKSFYSPALGVTKNYLVYLPPSYATHPTRRYPAAYFLHGSPGTERDWIDNLHLNVVFDSLETKAGVREMIAVMPDGDDSFYENWVTTPPCAHPGQADYCVQQAHYGDYIATDLVGTVDLTFRTVADAQHRAVAGLSMGGYGAMYLGLARPDVFGAVASLSGTQFSHFSVGVFPNDTEVTTLSQLPRAQDAGWITRYGTDSVNWRAHDPLSLARSEWLGRHPMPALWFIVGSGDTRMLSDNEILNRDLTTLGVPHYYAEPSGGHTIQFWGDHEADAATWVAAHFGS